MRATRPPSTLIGSLNTSNQNLEITILFIVVEGPGHYIYKEDPPSTARGSSPRARVVSYALGAYKVFIERVVVYALEGNHWIGNQKF